MPDQITAAGLETQTYEELSAQIISEFKLIFGSDININSDTPDGQLINFLTLMGLDVRDLIKQANAFFDPDQAPGIILDQRCAINGVQRQAGTYTITNVLVTTDRSVSLVGLNDVTTESDAYTVQDSAGNQWYLEESYTGSTATLAFRAKNIGAVFSAPNTITTPITIVIGVLSVNNPTTYTSLGLDEETDAQLKIRRQKSVSLSSQGYLSGLLAALLNISGVTSAYVYENKTGTTDGDGVPGHSIWVIVGGSGSNVEIANAIYQKRNAGCGMYGAQTFNIIQVDGNVITIQWDVVTDETIFIKFNAASLDGVNPPNIQGMRDGLVTDFVPNVYEKVNINVLADKAREIDPNSLITSAGFSSTAGGSYTDTKTPSAKNKQFRFTSAEVIILPMILNPPTSTAVNTTGTVQFSALGGYSTYTYSIHTNNSGGSINSSSGLYTAGATHPVTDTVRVTDSLGNYIDATVSVT